MNRSVGWPRPEQELVLSAALAEGDEAIALWEEWSAAVTLDDVDPGSFRVLPLLYRTLANAGVEEERLAKLKGVYRQMWSRNQLLFHRAAHLLPRLAEAGVDTLLLKGAALVTLYYRDVGVRPMEDLDLLVPTADAPRAMQVLVANGWNPTTPRPESRVAVWHADSFSDPQGQNLDLHWNAFWELSNDSDLWAGAVPTTLNGVPTKALGHADQLLHVCVHGLHWSPTPPIRWVADATTVIRVAGSELDWDRLVRVAVANHVTLPAGATLGYLAERGAPVPPAVLADLTAAKTTYAERKAFAVTGRRPNPAKMLRVLWDRHRRLRKEGGTIGFVTYVQRHAGLERRSQLPRHVVKQLRYGRWRRAR